MKKVILLFAAVLSVGLTNAQFKFGVQAGANLSSAKAQLDKNTEFDTKPVAGFQVGVVGELGLGKNLAFRPALQFISKGTKVESSNVFGESKVKYRLNYLSIPLDVIYKANVSPSIKLFGGLGPQIGYAISGKTKSEITVGGTTTKEDDAIDFGTNENDDDFKPLDFGLNFLGGIEMNNGFGVSLFYTAGLSNITFTNVLEDAKWRNNTFGLSLFYYIKK